jgi:cytochrome oxidase Cu insertion factor (SCO1/SenC/PrrC family)
MLRKIFGLVAVMALLTVAAFSQAAQPAAPPAQPAAKPPAVKTHLKVGDKAPDFMLVGVDGKTVQLKKLKGKTNVVLAFYPKAFSGG